MSSRQSTKRSYRFSDNSSLMEIRPPGERLSYDARPDRESISSGAADRTSPIEDHMTENVKTEIEAGIMTLTLSRADKKNALSHAMYSALSDGLERAEADATIRVILFQGDGDSFTAGNDIADFGARSGGTFQGESPAVRLITNMMKTTKPLIAAVQGNAV